MFLKTAGLVVRALGEWPSTIRIAEKMGRLVSFFFFIVLFITFCRHTTTARLRTVGGKIQHPFDAEFVSKHSEI